MEVTPEAKTTGDKLFNVNFLNFNKFENKKDNLTLARRSSYMMRAVLNRIIALVVVTTSIKPWDSASLRRSTIKFSYC